VPDLERLVGARGRPGSVGIGLPLVTEPTAVRCEPPPPPVARSLPSFRRRAPGGWGAGHANLTVRSSLAGSVPQPPARPNGKPGWPEPPPSSPDLLPPPALAFLEDHAYRHLREAEVLADAVAEVVLVGAGQERLAVDGEDERRRRHVDLADVEQLERLAVEVGRRLAGRPYLEPAVQLAGRDALVGGVEHADGGGKQLVQAEVGQGAGVDARREVQVEEL